MSVLVGGRWRDGARRGARRWGRRASVHFHWPLAFALHRLRSRWPHPNCVYHDLYCSVVSIIIPIFNVPSDIHLHLLNAILTVVILNVGISSHVHRLSVLSRSIMFCRSVYLEFWFLGNNRFAQATCHLKLYFLLKLYGQLKFHVIEYKVNGAA